MALRHANRRLSDSCVAAGLAVLCLAFGNGAPALSSGPEGCLGEPPLLETRVPLSSVCGQGLEAVLGEWRLPVSPHRPEVLTWGRLGISRSSLAAEEGSGGSHEGFLARFTFQDPLPYGLPFTFQRLELRLEEGDQVLGTAEADWAMGCTGPGRSIYPGQSFEERVAVPCSSGRSDEGLFLRVYLWGARM